MGVFHFGFAISAKISHNTYRCILISFFIFGLIAGNIMPVLGQSAPMKWGKIDKKILELKSFPQDSNAAAIVLCEYGDAFLNDQARLITDVHVRVKVLNEAGYDFGTVTLTYYAKNRSQKISGIKGETYNLASDGSINKTKLEKKSIFKEDVDGKRERIKFTLPALSPGCVFEYRYKLESKSPVDLEGWTFQTSEPVLWSEYRVWIPEYFRYVSYSQGFEQFDINESEQEIRYEIIGQKKRWVMKNVPALRQEPFITTRQDYLAKINFQLAVIDIPGQHIRQILKTWDVLVKELMDDSDFGKQARKKGLLPNEVKQQIASITDPVEKMKAVYTYLQNTVTWNGKRGKYAFENLKKSLEKKNASSAELSFMLTSILNELDIDAKPMLISTRNHGQIQQLYPIIDQFNYVLTHVNVNNKTYLLDATDRLRPYTLLPVQALNGIGLLMEKGNPRWITIKPEKKYDQRYSIKASLESSGRVVGVIESSDVNYSALFKRNYLEENDEADYIDHYFLSDLFGAECDSFSIENKDNISENLHSTIHFTTDEFAQTTGDFIYLNPLFLKRHEENPFKLPERKFPVDYAYGRTITYVLNLDLPEDFIVESLPKDAALRLPTKGGEFIRVCNVDGKKLNVLSKFVINKTRFLPGEYQSIKRFYDMVITAQNEQIVLKKATN